MKRGLLLTLVALSICAASSVAMSSSIVWQGTTSSQYHENLSAYFTPNTTPVTISGTLDITNLAEGTVELFGLIDKKLRDQGGYTFHSGAYLYLLKGSDYVTLGTSDGNLGGEITSDAKKIAGNFTEIDFTLTIGNGQITLTSSLLDGPKTRTYGTAKTLNNAFGYAWDEFEYGAYLAGNLWAPGSELKFNVTAESAVVPMPAAAWAGLALFGGLGGVNAVKRLRRRED